MSLKFKQPYLYNMTAKLYWIQHNAGSHRTAWSGRSHLPHKKRMELWGLCMSHLLSMALWFYLSLSTKHIEFSPLCQETWSFDVKSMLYSFFEVSNQGLEKVTPKSCNQWGVNLSFKPIQFYSEGAYYCISFKFPLVKV